MRKDAWIEKLSVSAPAWRKNWRERHVVLYDDRICWNKANGRAAGKLVLGPGTEVLRDDTRTPPTLSISRGGRVLVLRGRSQVIDEWDEALAGLISDVLTSSITPQTRDGYELGVLSSLGTVPALAPTHAARVHAKVAAEDETAKDVTAAVIQEAARRAANALAAEETVPLLTADSVECICNHLDLPALLALTLTARQSVLLPDGTRSMLTRYLEMHVAIRLMKLHYAPTNRRHMERVGLIAWTAALELDKAYYRALWAQMPETWRCKVDAHLTEYTQEKENKDGRRPVVVLTVASVMAHLW